MNLEGLLIKELDESDILKSCLNWFLRLNLLIIYIFVWFENKISYLIKIKKYFLYNIKTYILNKRKN